MKEFMRIKREFFATIILFILVSISYTLAQASSTFPQDKVDKVCLENRRKKGGLKDRTFFPEKPEESVTIGKGFFTDEVAFSRSPDLGFMSDKKGDLYIGPAPDTFLIDTNYVQDGDIIIFGEGILVVDSAKLTLSGQLFAKDKGQAIFRNDAHLHFNQFYVGQYFVWLVDSAKFEATDATVDANSVMHYVQIHNNSTYIAKNTSFPDWVFRKVFNTSTLILENVDHVGDFMVDDSCYIHLTRCDTLMPWFEMPDGSVVNIQFPDPDFVNHFELSDNTPSVDGIGYTFIADSCSQCWWSLETLPGCNVTINNSTIRGSCVRMFGSDTFNINGIENYTYHSSLTVPLSDRHLEYIDTYVYWWNWYPFEDIIFNIDSSSFGEMIGRGNSKTYTTNCIHDGATIMLGSGGDAFVSFVDGFSYSYVGTFENSTFLFVNSSITPFWPYQSTNLAHDHSCLLAVDSYFEYEPEAMEGALVMVTAIDSLSDDTIGATIDILGSAWIDAGLHSLITFDRYKLYWCLDGDSVWTLIEESTDMIHNDILASWNTSGLSASKYDLRLTIWNSAEDSLTAFGDITLLSTGIEETQSSELKVESAGLFQNYPNPFNPQTTISYQLPAKTNIILKIYDLLGREVRTLVDKNQLGGHHLAVWDGTDDLGREVTSGIYFCKLKADNFSQTKKLLLLR